MSLIYSIIVILTYSYKSLTLTTYLDSLKTAFYKQKIIDINSTIISIQNDLFKYIKKNIFNNKLILVDDAIISTYINKVIILLCFAVNINYYHWVNRVEINADVVNNFKNIEFKNFKYAIINTSKNPLTVTEFVNFQPQLNNKELYSSLIIDLIKNIETYHI
jgi:hypothetical protein